MLIRWEEIGDRVRRFRVTYIGWVVESYAITENGDRVALCFVPDAELKWESESNENKPKEGA